MFFVASTAPEGRVKVSPKGLDSLKVVSPTKIMWLSMTGGGNETAAHFLQDPRMTLMFCAFDGDSFTLRVQGDAQVIHPRDDKWNDLYAQFPDYAGARNIFRLSIDLVTTSCGSGVPEMSVVRPRAETDLVPWYAEMAEEGVDAFWKKKNVLSIDGDPTGIFADCSVGL